MVNKEPRVSNSGIPIYVSGQGESVVVIPGGPGFASTLYQKILEPLTKTLQMVFWDYRGTGRSRQYRQFGFDLDQADLCEVIDSLGVARVSILAHSYGGLHALKFAAQNPEKVSRLILISTTHCFKERNDTTDTKANLSQVELAKVAELFVSLKKNPRNSNHILNLLRLEAKNQFKYLSPENLKIFTDFACMDFEAMSQNEEWVDLDLAAYLPLIEAETLILTAENDNIVPARFSRKLKSDIRNATSIDFDKAGHWLFWEESDKFFSVVNSFFHRKKAFCEES